MAGSGPAVVMAGSRPTGWFGQPGRWVVFRFLVPPRSVAIAFTGVRRIGRSNVERSMDRCRKDRKNLSLPVQRCARVWRTSANDAACAGAQFVVERGISQLAFERTGDPIWIARRRGRPHLS